MRQHSRTETSREPEEVYEHTWKGRLGIRDAFLIVTGPHQFSMNDLDRDKEVLLSAFDWKAVRK